MVLKIFGSSTLISWRVENDPYELKNSKPSIKLQSKVVAATLIFLSHLYIGFYQRAKDETCILVWHFHVVKFLYTISSNIWNFIFCIFSKLFQNNTWLKIGFTNKLCFRGLIQFSWVITDANHILHSHLFCRKHGERF